MKNILALILCAFMHSTMFAQADQGKRGMFQLSFVTPLGTNGIYSAKYTNRVSLNLLVGVSLNEEAFALGGISNVILNDANGFYLAGISNHIGNESRGFQLAGIVNTNKNKFDGFQFAGVMNTSSGLRGFQFSGLINIAKDVRGFQFSGLMNKANKVRGVQLAGLVNVATDSDCPIGLINIIKNGEKSIAVSYNAVGNTVVSFRSGGKYTYGILGVGFNHRVKGKSIVAEGGLGVHVPITSWLRINNEIKLSSIGCDNPSRSVMHSGYSLLPGIKLGKSVELFVGGGINYMESNDTGNGWIFPNHSLWKKQSDTQLRQLYVGYEIGMQYIF